MRFTRRHPKPRRGLGVGDYAEALVPILIGLVFVVVLVLLAWQGGYGGTR